MVVEYKGFRSRWLNNQSSDNQLQYHQDDVDDPGFNSEAGWAHVEPASTSGLFGSDVPVDFSDDLADVKHDLHEFSAESRFAFPESHGDGLDPAVESEEGRCDPCAKDPSFMQPRPKSAASSSAALSWISSEVNRTADEMASRHVHKSIADVKEPSP